MESCFIELRNEYNLHLQHQQQNALSSSSSSSNHNITIMQSKMKEMIQLYPIQNILQTLTHHLFNPSVNNETTIDVIDINDNGMVIDDDAVTDDNNNSTRNNTLMISSLDAFHILGILIATNTSYIKIISKLIRYESTQLLISNTTNIKKTMIPIIELIYSMIEQMILSTDIELSNDAMASIVSCCQYNSHSIQYITNVFDKIVHFWKDSNTSIASSSRSTKSATPNIITDPSIIIVRCVTIMIELLIQVPTSDDIIMRIVITSGATHLLAQLLEEVDDDPLLIISIFDLLEKLCITLTTTTSTASSSPSNNDSMISKWLLSNEMIEPILCMAGGFIVDNDDNHKSQDQEELMDPILCGPALRIIALLCRLGLHHRIITTIDTTSIATTSSRTNRYDDTMILKGFYKALRRYVQETSSGCIISDRLLIVDAISSYASSSSETLQYILNDPILSEAWLTNKVAQPKLKSAILVSIAHTIRHVQLPSNDNNNDSNNTTTATTTTTTTPITTMTTTLINKDTDDIIALTVKTLSVSDGMKLISQWGHINSRNSYHDFSISSLLLELGKSPIIEIRLGVYTLIDHIVVCLSTIGIQLLLSHTHHDDGLYQFLINRANEETKIGKEYKYQILYHISCHTIIMKQLLSDHIVNEINLYIKRGPYYQLPLSFDIATAEA